MEPKISTSGAAFAKALRSVQTGGVAYNDFLIQIDQLLDAGASPDELLAILERREAVEALPDYAHEAVVRLLNDLHPKSAGNSAVPPEAPTVILEDTQTGDSPAADGAQTVAVRVGDVLGQRFHLIELIGEGGMSRVYKATDSQRAEPGAPDRFIAVKVLTRPFIEDSASFSLLEEEIHKLQRLTHPNIVRMFSCNHEALTVFLTMEYLIGESLYSRLHSRAADKGSQPGIGREDAESIITAVAGALEYAHQHQVIHGDLKPGNVIVTETGEIKVIDFGIASLIARPRSAFERREAAQRQTSSALTPRYASPQLMARQKPETTDDIYALACLAYELLTGSHPFDDGSGSPSLRSPPPFHAGLTPPQYAAVTKGLQYERRDRTPSVGQFLAEFTAPARRSAWRSRAIWFAAAAVLAVVGWFYGRPAPRVAAPPPPAANLAVPEPLPTPAPPLPAAGAPPGSVIRDCPTCPQMTVLPLGQFQQGSASAGSSPYEKPQHLVTIAYPFSMSTHDVTVGDFREFLAVTGRDMQGCDTYDGDWRRKPKASWKDPGFAQSDAHPVTCASWKDATAYAQWLSAKSGHRYRLPSASEWEYAARAGSEAQRPWGSGGAGACGDANVADQSAARRYPGWEVFACDDGYVNTAPVGSFKPNAFGLDDMLGNVFQWTEDCWHQDYTGAPIDGSARLDGDCAEHELRGGSWFSSPPYVRPSYRNHFAAGYRTSSVGFRLVREDTP